MQDLKGLSSWKIIDFFLGSFGMVDMESSVAWP
jgi:hypothetical protein